MGASLFYLIMVILMTISALSGQEMRNNLWDIQTMLIACGVIGICDRLNKVIKLLENQQPSGK